MIFVHQASADHPSLVQPHSLNALSAIVNWFTGGTQIRHFVMAITSVRVGSAVGEAAGSSRLLACILIQSAGHSGRRCDSGNMTAARAHLTTKAAPAAPATKRKSESILVTLDINVRH
jgi:hypothetical protein